MVATWATKGTPMRRDLISVKQILPTAFQTYQQEIQVEQCGKPEWINHPQVITINGCYRPSSNIPKWIMIVFSGFPLVTACTSSSSREVVWAPGAITPLQVSMRASQVAKSIAGWWFGTFFSFSYIGNNHPNWLSYFSEGLKPPTR